MRYQPEAEVYHVYNGLLQVVLGPPQYGHVDVFPERSVELIICNFEQTVSKT